MWGKKISSAALACVAFAMFAVAGCTSYEALPPATPKVEGPGPEYIIGPLDNLNIFVWRNPDVSISVPVRPDGRISTPLIEDLTAAGKTPTQLARDVEGELAKFIQDPIVTVIVTGFTGPFARQVRVVGQATRPQAIPYRDNMTLLDVMVAVGGITEFAAGNRAVDRAHGEHGAEAVSRAGQRPGQGRRRVGQRPDAPRRHPDHSGKLVLGAQASVRQPIAATPVTERAHDPR